MATIISQSLQSHSKKKPKSNRSAFLSALMKTVGGDDSGLADSFMGADQDSFEGKMLQLVKKLKAKMPNKGHA